MPSVLRSSVLIHLDVKSKDKVSMAMFNNKSVTLKSRAVLRIKSTCGIVELGAVEFY